jgi:hypothetical protein
LLAKPPLNCTLLLGTFSVALLAKFEVTSPPLSMTAPPPSASEMFVLKPARSMLAPASTVVCGALPRRNEKLCVGGRDRAGLDVSAANGEGDDTAGISMPEIVPSFPSDPTFSIVFALMA